MASEVKAETLEGAIELILFYRERELEGEELDRVKQLCGTFALMFSFLEKTSPAEHRILVEMLDQIIRNGISQMLKDLQDKGSFSVTLVGGNWEELPGQGFSDN